MPDNTFKDASFHPTPGARLRSRDDRVTEARTFNLLSNVFMSVALNDIPACQHVLRILTQKQDLVVKEVRTQYRISKLTSHDAILDILAEDETNRLYNLEIHRSDTIDHARRTRFYGSMVDSEFLQKGKDYDEMPDVHVIYISETDLWHAGQAVYTVRKCLNQSGIPYCDGFHITYVNAAINDNTEIAGLMHYFKTADPDDMSQGDLSKRVRYLKCEEGGYDIMCQITDKFVEEGRQEQARATSINLARMNLPVEQIAEAVQVSVSVVKQWLAPERV